MNLAARAASIEAGNSTANDPAPTKPPDSIRPFNTRPLALDESCPAGDGSPVFGRGIHSTELCEPLVVESAFFKFDSRELTPAMAFTHAEGDLFVLPKVNDG